MYQVPVAQRIELRASTSSVAGSTPAGNVSDTKQKRKIEKVNS